MQKLKGLSSSTKLFVIGITTLARMAIISNYVNNLHNLQNFNDETMDLVYKKNCIILFMFFWSDKIMNNMETLLQALHPCLHLLCHYWNFHVHVLFHYAGIDDEWSKLHMFIFTHKGIKQAQPMNISSNPQGIYNWGLEMLLC